MGKVGEIEKNGGNWRIMGWGKAGKAQGMWVEEGCGRMWLKKMGEKWEKNGRKMGRDTPFSHFPHSSGGRRCSPQFPL